MVQDGSIKMLYKQSSKYPDIQIGLHLNLIEKKSLDGKQYIPSLVNKKGFLFPLPIFLILNTLKRINPDHIRREIEKQIDFLTENGLKVSFIDSHQHTHAFSPVAEIVTQVASEKGIPQIRTYNRIRTFTLIAKIKYRLLKLAAYFSHYITYGKLDLPVTWKGNGKTQYSIMSCEGGGLDVLKLKSDSLVLVTHPYLPFDSNKSYIWTLI